MLDPYWVLATGSRYYADVVTVRRTLQEVAATHPGREFVLMHGQCDPRHRLVPERVIPWRAGEKLLPEDQLDLLGGDWLADLVARELGWPIKRCPADWELHGPRAGFIRNSEMIKEMAAAGAARGNGECVAFTTLCLSARCRIAEPHQSHGTAHCVNHVRAAGIPVRNVPAVTERS